MAGFVKGSEAEKRNKIRRHKEYITLRGLIIEGYDMEIAGLVMEKPYIYLKGLKDEFDPIADVDELIY